MLLIPFNRWRPRHEDIVSRLKSNQIDSILYEFFYKQHIRNSSKRKDYISMLEKIRVEFLMNNLVKLSKMFFLDIKIET